MKYNTGFESCRNVDDVFPLDENPSEYSIDTRTRSPKLELLNRTSEGIVDPQSQRDK